MAEQVELDTDDAQEQEVSIEQTEKKVEEDIGAVDLGYTDPIKKDTKAEIKTEEEKPAQDNLEQLSEGVQKRINQLTRKMREAERREKAALDYAKGLQSKYDKAEKEKQGD